MDTSITGGSEVLPPYEVVALDSLEGSLARIQHALVGYLVAIHGGFYRVFLENQDHILDDNRLNFTCEVAGHTVGVSFQPDFSHGWLGDHQLSRVQLENPLIASVYADHLTSVLPEWVANLRLGEVLKSAVQFGVAVKPVDSLAQAPLQLCLALENLHALQSVFAHIQQFLVPAEQQRLDSFKVSLPLVAASVTLTSRELAALAPSDIIRLT